MVILKYSSSGDLQWNTTWGGSGREIAKAMTIGPTGNIYVTGVTDSFGLGLSDMVLVKFDGSGVFQWYKTRGGGEYDEGTGIVLDSANNIYIVGSTFSFGAGSRDMLVVKYDDSGDYQWFKTKGGTDDEHGTGIALDSLENIYISGFTSSFSPGNDHLAVVKYDGSGTELWSCIPGGNEDKSAYDIALDSDDNIYLVGAYYETTSFDLYN